MFGTGKIKCLKAEGNLVQVFFTINLPKQDIYSRVRLKRSPGDSQS